MKTSPAVVIDENVLSPIIFSLKVICESLSDLQNYFAREHQ